MANKKKVSSKTPSSKKDIKAELTEQEVYDVLKFTSEIYNQYNNVYTPDLVNARMKDITLSPQTATVDRVNSALLEPKSNEQQLIGYSEFMELNSMLYKRILLYFSGLMAFDFNYVCINAEDKDYDSPTYKKDLAEVKAFFDRFNMKAEFRTIVKQMLRQEAYYGVLREEGRKIVMQELPQQYCKITGRWDYGLLFDFNMNFFLQPATNLDMFPDVFKRFYKKAFGDKMPDSYNPALPVDSRLGSWVYWVQTRPKDGFTAFKFFPEIATVIPFLAPLLGDVVLQSSIRALQTNSYIQEASKIIFGQVEFLKDASSKVKDALTLAPETLGKFLALVKSGLPDAIKVAAAPLANTSAIEFKGSDTIYDSFLKTTASVSGVNSRLIYSFDRQNVLETKLSMDIDQNILRPVYTQFENMLEYWVNKKTKKFKFKFFLEGFNTSLDRAERMDTVSKLADSGIVLEQKYASALGMSPFDFRRMLQETKANKFVEKLTPILKSNQMAGAGRPSLGDDKLGEAGANSRADGSNEEKESE